MVTAKTQYNLANAREYFEEHLCVGDYYDEGQRVAGEWFGLGVQRLGLAGRVRADDFLRLCENQHPSSGETLTQRLNTTRTEGAGGCNSQPVILLSWLTQAVRGWRTASVSLQCNSCSVAAGQNSGSPM